MTYEYDPENLPNAEELSINNELEFVGLYMRVYNDFVDRSTKLTSLIMSTDLNQARLASNIMLPTENKLEWWLHSADEFLPDWFDSKLLDYPDIPLTVNPHSEIK